MPAVSRARLAEGLKIARAALLDEQSPNGCWRGKLSTSALATATAVMALIVMRRSGHAGLDSLIARGLEWLAAHQKPDGGWGDTLKSHSNISTTMLGRAVFRAAGQDDSHPAIVAAAERYIEAKGGVPAVVARYGKDRTFSVPILTHCAIAGLVDWGSIPPLPFELACLPARFYKAVRLPVVSYALPALIAIGQVRHHFHKPRNPVSRWIRNWAREPSLRVLTSTQPDNGGFLEATPLTSFVTMSLAAMGRAEHPVAQRGTQFIIDSVRDDGSWPIDTDLATWVTTLAVNALAGDVPAESRADLLQWLLTQQYRERHPYTNADPGGWAWTDLPGGVPDADDTPGALLAIANLMRAPEMQPFQSQATAAARSGVTWLLGLQNRDGGWPTFCRGWGTQPFDRSSPDITAHVLRGLNGFTDTVSFPQMDSAIRRGSAFLDRSQRPDGSWLPLWFGNQDATNDENPTYGTSRVLAAFRDLGQIDTEPAQRGLHWLRTAQHQDGGWGAGSETPSSVEETALALEILAADPASADTVSRGLTWLLQRVEDGSFREPSPIGFYFAKLWYFERLYPLVFTVAALTAALRTTED